MKKYFAYVLILFVTLSFLDAALATAANSTIGYRQLLVIWDNVNYRAKPLGKVIDRLDYGETLLWIDELRSEDELW